ncbi:MAG: hypothetical protein WCZ86_08220 [Desulfurivibrionaceae bacterium]
MKNTLSSEKRSAAPVVAHATGKLAETFWFVSSFVMSLLMGPFAAVPAIIAVFSLKIDGPMPLNIS